MKLRAILMGSGVIMLIMLLVNPVWAQAIPRPISRATTPTNGQSAPTLDWPAVDAMTQLTVTPPLAPASANGVYRKGYHRLTDNAVEDDVPVTTFNAARNEYLVVWSECPVAGACNIVGRRTTKQGEPIAAPFTISSGHNDRSPAIGYNSYYGEYLVTYERHAATDSDLYGRIVLGSGTLYSIELTIAADADYQAMANIAFNPVITNSGHLGEYLVVYQEAGDIWAKTVGSYGDVATTAILIDAPTQFTTPDVAYNPVRNEYLVAYAKIISDTPPIHNNDIYARRLNANGYPVTTPIFVHTGSLDATRPQVAVGADTYFIAYERGPNDLIGSASIVGSWVEGDGNLIYPLPVLIAESPPAGLGKPRVAYTGYGFFVTWQSIAGADTGNVYGRYMHTRPDAAGGAWGSVFAIDDTPGSDQTNGDIACTGGSCLFVDRDEWNDGTDGEITAWSLWMQQVFLPLTLN